MSHQSQGFYAPGSLSRIVLVPFATLLLQALACVHGQAARSVAVPCTFGGTGGPSVVWRGMPVERHVRSNIFKPKFVTSSIDMQQVGNLWRSSNQGKKIWGSEASHGVSTSVLSGANAVRSHSHAGSSYRFAGSGGTAGQATNKRDRTGGRPSGGSGDKRSVDLEGSEMHRLADDMASEDKQWRSAVLADSKSGVVDDSAGSETVGGSDSSSSSSKRRRSIMQAGVNGSAAMTRASAEGAAAAAAARWAAGRGAALGTVLHSGVLHRQCRVTTNLLLHYTHGPHGTAASTSGNGDASRNGSTGNGSAVPPLPPQPLCKSSTPPPPRVRWVVLGDSVDVAMCSDLCALSKWRHHLPAGMTCEAAGTVTGMEMLCAHFFGVSPMGPYHKPHENIKTFNQHLAEVKAAAQRQRWWGGDAPPIYARPGADLVLVSSNFWDIARHCGSNYTVDGSGEVKYVVSEQCRTRGDQHAPPTFPPGFIAAWKRNFTAIVTQAREAFAGAVFVTHTTAAPLTFDSGNTRHAILGHVALVQQINTATRQVAQQLGLHLVDFEHLAMGLPGTLVLRDRHHPAPWFTAEAANVFLNILFAERCGECSGDCPFRCPWCGRDGRMARWLWRNTDA